MWISLGPPILPNTLGAIGGAANGDPNTGDWSMIRPEFDSQQIVER